MKNNKKTKKLQMVGLIMVLLIVAFGMLACKASDNNKKEVTVSFNLNY